MSEPAVAAVPVLVGFDGSLSATTAVQVGGRLLPMAVAHVVYLWEPPFASPELRHRLAQEARSLDDLMQALEREGRAEAERIAALGVAVARAAGWTAEPLVERSYGGLGYQFARLAEQSNSDVILVGSRGLSGLKAMLGSVSDVVVQISPVPVLVIPHPLTISEWTAAAEGPVVVAHDGSSNASQARATAARLFPGRALLQATVAADGHNGGSHTDDGVVLLRRRGHGATGIAHTLADYAAQQRAAAIAVGSSGQSDHHATLLGDVARAVTHHAQRPVLVVPTGNRLNT